MIVDPVAITERFKGTLSDLLGIRFVEAGAGRAGTVRAESTPLHRGRLVWQTRATDESGRPLSLTIQTQMVLT